MGKSQARTATKAHKRPIARGGALRLPPPANGVAYSLTELSKLMGGTRRMVEQWCARGVKGADGRQVRLRSLRVPRGHVAPEELRRFLGAANGVTVEIEK